MSPETNWPVDLFGRSLGDCPFADHTIGRQQQLMLDTAANLPIEFGPGVVASQTFIRWFLQMAQLSETSCHAATKVGPADREFGRGDSDRIGRGGLVHHDLRFVRPGPGAQPVVVPAIDSADVRPQTGRLAGPILSPRGPSFIWTVECWTDLLAVNLLAVQARVATIGPASPEGATIHETAVVEDCELGAGVEIGPHAVVRRSVVGDRVTIGDHTSVVDSVLGSDTVVRTGGLVHTSVIGPETEVGFHTVIVDSLMLGRSTISTALVARSVIGEEVFIARTASLGVDRVEDEPTRVEDESTRPGAEVRGQGLVGCAVGNGSRIGSGMRVPAGTVVPAGLFLAETPSNRIASADADTNQGRTKS